ncbi:hypothetical protein BpHYR1_003495 [Brachionus plicatilis]|uniref:Uncharacterized protein n=1 Tax=Brachionus plicatilis TaxID=10195 RepID=A0A3M7QH08_BRAPC|nr:hypothetical protein BpHYR1_003495 [Brachionus plicatilis]
MKRKRKEIIEVIKEAVLYIASNETVEGRSRDHVAEPQNGPKKNFTSISIYYLSYFWNRYLILQLRCFDMALRCCLLLKIISLKKIYIRKIKNTIICSKTIIKKLKAIAYSLLKMMNTVEVEYSRSSQNEHPQM